MRNIILLIAVSFFGLGCMNKPRTETAQEMDQKTETSAAAEKLSVSLSEAQLKNTAIQLGQLEEKPIAELLKVFGKIDVPPQNMVSVSIPMGGYLRSTKLLAGMHVNKGEILAIMEDQQYIQLQQDYLTTQAQMSSLEKAYQRQQRLNSNQAGSEKALQQAEADYKSARIALRALAERLRLININPDRLNEERISRSIQVLSPISGFVSKVNVNVGKYVNAAEVLFELVNPEDIHLGLTIFEKDLDKLSIGQRVYAYTNSNPDKKYPAEIILISRDLDSAHTAEVHCHFEEYDKSLMPGMYMNGEIELNNQKAAVLPADAFISQDGKDYVFVQEQEREFTLVPVERGASEEGYVSLKNADMLKGKQVVIKGSYALLMEMNKGGAEEEE